MRRLTSAAILLIALLVAYIPTTHGQETSHTFPETGKTVRGRFLQYWQEGGGLAQFGYPISSEIGEKSPTNGRVYTVQYFERALFEYHPENQPPTDVLLALLGSFTYQQKYPNGAPGQTPHTSGNSKVFSETGKRIGGTFLAYWNSHGSLAQQGLPISDEFQEKSALDGKIYIVQYFERAVFELHSENPASSNVLLTQLGTVRYQQIYATGPPSLKPPVALPPAIPKVIPTATAKPKPAPTTKPAPTAKPVVPPSSGVRCGATCRDGSHSSATGRGACSHHGGVDHWLYCDLIP